MSGSAKDLRDWMMQRDQTEPIAAAARTAAVMPGVSPVFDESAWRIAAAAIGLLLAAVLPPIAVGLVTTVDGPPWPPWVVSALVALLVLAPVGIGIVAALLGLQRLASLAAQAGYEAEYAVLRVLVVATLLGYVLVLTPIETRAADCIPLVAPWLIAAWAMLLYVLLWPTAQPFRRYAGMALDLLLFSGLLHLGGSDVAGWYPLYLTAIFYVGLRFGVGALIAAAAAAIIGFAAVVLSTEIWRRQPVLAAGLLGGLTVLPAFIAGAIRGIAAARTEAAQAEAARQYTLLLIADTLRGPPTMTRAAETVAPPVQDVLDFAALEAGSFAPPLEVFDLRLLVRQALMPLQAKAAEGDVALRWRIDPRLPCRLRGYAQGLARILSGLADHAIDVAQGAIVRISIVAGAHDARRIRLQVRVDGLSVQGDPDLRGDEIPLALRLVHRLIGLANGTFAIDSQGQRTRLTVTLPLTIETGAAGPALDLQRRPVLLVTEDDELARELAEPLAAWNGEPRWPGDPDGALAELAARSNALRPIVIIDGRDKLLSALGLAHQAARLGASAPFVLLLAGEAQISSLAEVDEGELDGFIPAPVTEQLLVHAIHGLPLEPHGPLSRSDEPAPRLPEGRATGNPAPPSLASEPPCVIDAQAIERLLALGGGHGFLSDLIETFLADARQIMQRLKEAAGAADPDDFASGLMALRRAAGHLGGAQLCDLAASLQHVTASELHEQGAVQLRRIEAEIDRLANALTESAPANRAVRS